jgi:hypothetical protein
MTKNSQQQIIRALAAKDEASHDPNTSAGRFLEEVMQNTADQTFAFLYYWASFMLKAAHTKTPFDALQQGLQLKSNFNCIGPILQHTVDVLTIRVYAQTLIARSETTTSGTFNHSVFL